MTEPVQACAAALPELLQGAQQLDLTIDLAAQERFLAYCNLLLEANAQFNLTAVRDPAGIMRTLFLDSLSIIPFLPARIVKPAPHPVRLVDVGTGAGIPGLPLHILFPHWQVALIDSTGKKARFVRYVAQQLGLDGVTVLDQRAEEVGRSATWRDRADLCLARAVAPLATLIELCAPLVRPGGTLIFPKSGDLRGEMAQGQAAMRALRVRDPAIHPVSSHLGLGDDRKIVLLTKQGATPNGYPRRIGLAKTQPIGARPR